LVADELLTGRAPFGELRTLHVLNAQLNQIPPPAQSLRPELPEAVGRALARQLSKDPAARYPSARQFVDALRAIRSPIGAPAPAQPPRSPGDPRSVAPPAPARLRTRWAAAQVSRFALETDLVAGSLGVAALLALMFLLHFHPLFSLALAGGVFFGVKLALPDLNPDRPVADDLTAGELRSILGRWRSQVAGLQQSAGALSRPSVRDRVLGIAGLTERLLTELERSPAKVRPCRFALTFLLDATAELAGRYSRFSAQSGAPIQPLLDQIEDNLGLIQRSLERLSASLQQAEILDLEAFLQVLQQTLRLEGIWAVEPTADESVKADRSSGDVSERD
jgi:hypothetical protein